MARKGSWNEINFEKDEITYRSKDGKTTLSVCPTRNVITGWNVDGWDVLYRPKTTKNLMRAGLPTMVPNFSSLKDKKFNETGTSLPHHGFGRILEWKPCEKRETGMSFSLDWNEETYKMYPFKFRFTVSADLSETGSLIHKLTMENLETDKTLPVQPGLHPYFTCNSSVKKQIKTTGIDGFNAADWEWTEVSNTPDNNYSFPADGVSISIPGHGKIQMQEIPDEGRHYHRIQVWSEHQNAPDKEFVCFEPVVWGADGMNQPEHRVNVPPKSKITITMKFTATKE